MSKRPKVATAQVEADEQQVDAAPASTFRRVKWTAKGEATGGRSEHGRHVAGELVETEHADALIERGFAEAE